MPEEGERDWDEKGRIKKTEMKHSNRKTKPDMGKKIIYTFLCCIGFTLANAQTPGVAWDSTYRPGKYVVKYGQFKSYPDSPDDIIFLGNSITEHTHWNELLGRSDVRNRGIGGDITFGVLERLDEVIEGRPARVFILIGINDISRNIPDEVILKNYQKIIDRIQEGTPRTEIYFQTLLPVNNTFTRYKNHYNKDGHIHAVNEGLKKIAAREGITLIDLHPHFLDDEGRLDKRYTLEGLHLNAAGYRLWAKILQPYLK